MKHSPARHRRSLFLIFAGAFFLSTTQAATHVVTVGDSFFSPDDLTIEPGDTVRWENAPGGAGHDLDSDQGLWATLPVSNEWTFEHTFNDEGVFTYHCNPHQAIGMDGTVRVEAAQMPGPTINPGMNDAWVSADAPLQGFFFTVFPDISFFFLSWFTFDTEADAGTATFGAADQRWVTGGGVYSGNTVTVSVELTSGGVFNAADPMATQTPGYGTITIEFVSCNEAILAYDFPSVGLSGQMTLTRAVTDNVPLCESLAAP
jgi:plastocyanin